MQVFHNHVFKAERKGVGAVLFGLEIDGNLRRDVACYVFINGDVARNVSTNGDNGIFLVALRDINIGVLSAEVVFA
jgi:hypothetical protein